MLAKGLGQIYPILCPLLSEWFYNFMRGMEYHMGCQSQPNHGLLIGVIVHLLKLIKVDAWEAKEAGYVMAANELWKIGAYVCMLAAALLQGHEGFNLDLTGLCKHLHMGKTGIILAGLDKNTALLEEMCMNLPHITICLLGKFKGETGVDHHLITVANKTTSGLCPRWWIEKLTEVCQSEGRFDGTAFASADGLLASSTDYAAMFRKYLNIVQDETNLIPVDHNVYALYSTFCMPRKTVTKRIEQDGFGNQFVDQMNWWRPQERAQGGAAWRRMNAHYTKAHGWVCMSY